MAQRTVHLIGVVDDADARERITGGDLDTTELETLLLDEAPLAFKVVSDHAIEMECMRAILGVDWSEEPSVDGNEVAVGVLDETRASSALKRLETGLENTSALARRIARALEELMEVELDPEDIGVIAEVLEEADGHSDEVRETVQELAAQIVVQHSLALQVAESDGGLLVFATYLE